MPRSQRSTATRTPWTSCCAGRTTGWLTGARQPRSSPTGGSSTSRRWPGCGWKTKPSSPAPTSSFSRWSRAGSSTGCGAGTTGYDFLNRVNQLFVDSGNEAAIRACYARATGEHDEYAEVVHGAKLQIMREELAAEVERLTGGLADVCERHRRQRDHTRRELRDALREVVAAFPVYRSYP